MVLVFVGLGCNGSPPQGKSQSGSSVVTSSSEQGVVVTRMVGRLAMRKKGKVRATSGSMGSHQVLLPRTRRQIPFGLVEYSGVGIKGVRRILSFESRSGRLSAEKLTGEKLLQFINGDIERAGIVDYDVRGLPFGFQIQLAVFAFFPIG